MWGSFSFPFFHLCVACTALAKQKPPPTTTTTTTPPPPPPSVSPINCLSHPDNDPFIGEKRGKWCRNGGSEGREDCVEKRGSAGGVDGDEMSIWGGEGRRKVWGAGEREVEIIMRDGKKRGAERWGGGERCQVSHLHMYGRGGGGWGRGGHRGRLAVYVVTGQCYHKNQ